MVFSLSPFFSFDYNTVTNKFLLEAPSRPPTCKLHKHPILIKSLLIYHFASTNSYCAETGSTGAP